MCCVVTCARVGIDKQQSLQLFFPCKFQFSPPAVVIFGLLRVEANFNFAVLTKRSQKLSICVCFMHFWVYLSIIIIDSIDLVLKWTVFCLCLQSVKSCFAIPSKWLLLKKINLLFDFVDRFLCTFWSKTVTILWFSFDFDSISSLSLSRSSFLTCRERKQIKEKTTTSSFQPIFSFDFLLSELFADLI